MRLVSLLAAGVLFATQAQAKCILFEDSASWKVDLDKVSKVEYIDINVNVSLNAIRYRLWQTNCPMHFMDEFIGHEKSCSAINNNSPFSRACYIENNRGYFITTMNYFQQVFVTFTRWD